ncbi:choline/ethanolamine kinase-like [Oppia nitens]|uniref:choline/ethanolamine kinase-like n=1 Tax=Oppia nitens TaxID=1686743 RepID=UPI0023DCAC0A|nr:choline/ethanolamine kinase-like [Oppia nitens]
MESNDQQSNSCNDVKSLDNLDIDFHETIRGQTPEDIKEQCLQVCQDYIAGDWIKQTVETIEVTRITGGVTNQLYKCAINESDANPTVPNVVAVRIYGSKWSKSNVYDGNERLSDIIISMMVSERKLGPKLLGVFNGGEISVFHNHRQFKLEEQKNAKLVEELFRKIARIHAMDVPLIKKHWVFDEIDGNYQKVMNQSSIPQLIDQLNCETLKTVDISDEINWLKEKVIEIGSPMVFSHNDLLSSNIMVLEDNDNHNSEEQILICDYEYGCYGYRGSDLGSIISEWGRLWSDFKVDHNLIDDSIINQLLGYYIDENIKIFGINYSENPINSMNQLVKEVKLFVLIGKICLILFCLRIDEHSDDMPNETVFLQLAERTYKNYLRLKTTIDL